MGTPDIKAKLHQEIDSGTDELLQMIDAVIKRYNDSEGAPPPRTNTFHFSEQSPRTYPWEEIKKTTPIGGCFDELFY